MLISIKAIYDSQNTGSIWVSLAFDAIDVITTFVSISLLTTHSLSSK